MYTIHNYSELFRIISTYFTNKAKDMYCLLINDETETMRCGQKLDLCKEK